MFHGAFGHKNFSNAIKKVCKILHDGFEDFTSEVTVKMQVAFLGQPVEQHPVCFFLHFKIICKILDTTTTIGFADWQSKISVGR